jgi:purine-binding chemotaxis protein CheW
VGNGSNFKNGSGADNGSRHYLTFRVARQDLALDAGRIRAILPAEQMVPIGSGRAGVIGVVHLRGHAVVVVDLRVRLALEASSRGAQPRIVVVEAAGARLAGLLVDRVTDVTRYRSRDLRRGILRGIGRPRRVLDVDRVVQEDDLVRLWSIGT